MCQMREILQEDERAAICDQILRALPSWFGIEESIVNYVNQVRTLPFFAAMAKGRAVGFVAVKVHNPHTAEVCVMGIERAYHRQGIGRRLMACCEQYARQQGMEFLTVKTLDAAHPDEGYKKTRLFYQAMGFKPLEVFPLLWDENNPCLFMAKTVG